MAKTVLKDAFLSRGFLIKNLPIDTIAGRIMIDFNQQETQIIPYLDRIR
jgi:hypothetical protein